jgi:hypothetical protein
VLAPPTSLTVYSKVACSCAFPVLATVIETSGAPSWTKIVELFTREKTVGGGALTLTLSNDQLKILWVLNCSLVEAVNPTKA